MIVVNGVNRKEKKLMKAVEKAVFARLKQDNFFVTYIDIVDEQTIRDYNRNNRQVDKVTDVLSFPYFEKMKLPVEKSNFGADDYDGRKVMLGSLMICRKRAEEQAIEYGHSYEREISFLTCHGLLHLLGFDHIEPDDEKIMFPLQTQIMDDVKQKR